MGIACEVPVEGLTDTLAKAPAAGVVEPPAKVAAEVAVGALAKGVTEMWWRPPREPCGQDASVEVAVEVAGKAPVEGLRDAPIETVEEAVVATPVEVAAELAVGVVAEEGAMAATERAR